MNCCDDDRFPVLPSDGSCAMLPLTPPGGIGRMVGRPMLVVVLGAEVDVEDGYIMDCDMGYALLNELGGPMVAGEMCEKALELAFAIDDDAGVCGVVGVCDALGWAYESEPNCA